MIQRRCPVRIEAESEREEDDLSWRKVESVLMNYRWVFDGLMRMSKK